MLAAWYESLGDAKSVLKVGRLPRPIPEAGEVLVRVHASGINPSDVKKRAGWQGGKIEFPRVVPHSDGAGAIIAVGSGVDASRLDERVWIFNAQHARAMGSAAQFVAIPSEQAVSLPPNTSWHQGACLGVPACTAHNAVCGHGCVDGLTVLIHGGAGAVGELAIQIAAISGANVIATVSDSAKADIARERGASHVLNYRTDDVVDAVMAVTGGRGVDRIVDVDFGANVDVNARVIALRGDIASYSSTRRPRFDFDYYAFGYKGVSLRFVQVYALTKQERGKAVADINAWLAAEQLHVRIAQAFPLPQIADAHRAQENSQRIGNVVLDIDHRATP